MFSAIRWDLGCLLTYHPWTFSFEARDFLFGEPILQDPFPPDPLYWPLQGTFFLSEFTLFWSWNSLVSAVHSQMISSARDFIYFSERDPNDRLKQPDLPPFLKDGKG
jgi:hypothetical protein